MMTCRNREIKASIRGDDFDLLRGAGDSPPSKRQGAESWAKLATVSEELSGEPPTPPEQVGPYRIESRIGFGGMGAVYRAYDRRLERTVAIKHVLPDAAETSNARERLRREARAVASLNHPAIVQIFDIVEMEDGDWIVMELVEGESLHSLVERGALGLVPAIQIAQEVAEGLAEAHDKGIVHRDLKTENVMVTRAGHAKILDFGLAKQLWKGPGDSTLSVQGSILGTGRAMSPEQAMGDTVDHRSDLFSFGSLLYEAITGAPPFGGSSIFHTLAQVCSERQKPAIEMNPEVPEELSRLVDRLLEKNPENRPADAGGVAEELGRFVTELGGGSEAPRFTQPSTVIPGPPRRDVSAVGTPTGGDPTPAVPRAVRGRERPFTRVETSSSIYIKTLVATALEVVDDGDGETGATPAPEVIDHHRRLLGNLLARIDGVRELGVAGDAGDAPGEGALLLFERPADAVRFALEYHERLSWLSEEVGVEVVARVGVHLAEVMAHGPSPPGTVELELEIDAETRQVPARLAEVAVAGQTLLTQGAFELARRTLAGVRVAGRGLRWESLGERAVEEEEEPAPIYAVVLEGSSLALEPSQVLAPVGDRRSGGAGRRWLTWAVTAVLVALVAVFGLLRFTGPSGGSGDGISPEARPAVAVLGFKNSSPSPEATAWLGTALAEMLGSELSAGETLRLIPGESVARMKLELDLEGSGSLARDTLVQVRRILGTDYVIAGSYTVVGIDGDRRLRIDLKLQDTRREGNPVAVSVTGEEAELFDLVAEAGAELRNKLGVEEPSLSQAQAVAAALPASREAAQHYSEGLELLRGFDAQAALEVLEQAVEADPDFALAHAALSEAWTALGYDLRAEESARRAYELAGELPEVDQRLIEGRYHEASAQWRKAIETYQALWRVFPDSVDYGLRLAGAQITAGRGREALATLERLHELPPPAGEDPRIDLMEGRAAYELFDYERDLAAAGRAERKGRELGARILVAEALQLRGQALMQLARIEEAEDALSDAERLFTEAGDRGKVAEVLDTRGVLRFLEGDLDRAEELMRQGLEIHQRTGNRKAVSVVLNHLALVEHIRGELAEARRLLAEAVEIAREIADRNAEAQYLDTTAWVALHQGELEEARELANRELALYRQIGSREGEGWGHYYLGQVALAAGELARAREEQEQAVAIAEEAGDPYQRGYVLQALGEVLLAAGELDAAAERLAESEDARIEFGERGPLAEARAASARLLLARGREAAAVELLRGVAEELRSLGNRDYEADARALLARALLAVGDLEGAEEAAEGARELGASSENPHVRLSVALATAEVGAARGRGREARRRLEAAVAEAERLGLVAAGLQLRLALGELELDAGLPGARPRLEELARDAKARGFERIAAEARERAG